MFTTFNREFAPLGFDPRYALVVLALFLVAMFPINRRYNPMLEKRGGSSISMGDLFAFFAIIGISNIAWFWNGLPLDFEQFVNILILNGNNLLAVCVFSLYRNALSKTALCKSILFAGIVLVASMVWVNGGNTIPPVLMAEDFRQFNSGVEFLNLFGQPIRVSGFAEDANYACVMCLMAFGVAFATKSTRRTVKWALALCFALGFGLSFSRTMLIGLLITLVVYALYCLYRNVWNIVSLLVVCAFPIVALLVLPNAHLFGDMATMTNRYWMWDSAEGLFAQNPIFGSGTSSSRSWMLLVYGKYVQCHSTWWQIASEQGIIGIVVFTMVCVKRLKVSRSALTIFIIMQFLIYSINFETAFLQLLPFSLCLCPLVFDGYGSDPSKERL